MALVEALIGGRRGLPSPQHHGPGNRRPRSEDRRPDNLIGAINLLEVDATARPLQDFVHVLRGTVYGIPEDCSHSGDAPFAPHQFVRNRQSAIEHYLEMYRRTRGFSPIIVRASNPFDPRQAHSGVQGVISTFLRRILAGRPDRNLGRRRRRAGLPRSRRLGGALRSRRNEPQRGRIQCRQRTMDCQSTTSSRPFAM